MAKQASPSKQNKQSNGIYYFGLVVLWLVGNWLSFATNNEVALNHYHLSRHGYDLIVGITSLPSLFIWLAMLFATLSFYRYAQQIAGSKDEPGFRYIAYALTAMLAGSVAGTLLRNVENLLTGNDMTSAAHNHFLVAGNLLSIVTYLFTFGFLYRGSVALMDSIKQQLHNNFKYLKIILPLVVLSILYLVLIFSNSSRSISDDPAISPTYAMPDVLIILLIFIPTVITWILSLLALAGIYTYRKTVQGIVYKQLFKNLVNGMTIIVVTTIGLQLLTQFSSSLSGAGLSTILALIAVIYIVLVIAMLLVARGARQLNKIETLNIELKG